METQKPKLNKRRSVAMYQEGAPIVIFNSHGHSGYELRVPMRGGVRFIRINELLEAYDKVNP